MFPPDLIESFDTEDSDGDLTVGGRVAGEVDLLPPTLAEQPRDPVAAAAEGHGQRLDGSGGGVIGRGGPETAAEVFLPGAVVVTLAAALGRP